MDEMTRKELMLEVMAELQPEIEAARSAPLPIKPSQPLLSRTLEDYLPLPAEALFLGVAMDRLPVLLNLQDPVPGPLLITGDQESGKTAFLQIVARGVDQVHQANEVQYGVITAYPEEWNQVSGAPNCVDIFPSYKNESQDFLNSLSSWTHVNRGERQSVLLLIDDLSVIAGMDFEARQSLRWLLLRGPARRVWPIVTLNPSRLAEARPWMDFFHTRLFGRMQNAGDVARLANANVLLGDLTPGSEFMMREGEDWLKFWIPAFD